MMRAVGIRILCLCLVATMLLCALPIYATEAESHEATAPRQIIRISKDIAKGTKISTDMLIEEKVAEGTPIPENAIKSIDEAKGYYATMPLYGGEYIYKQQISSKAVSKADEGVLIAPITDSTEEYVIVTDYIKPDTGKDVAAYLQELIDKNPNRTIYFPDGEYVITEPLNTASLASKSVSLHFSDGAVLKASDHWRGPNTNTGGGLINLGMLTKEENNIVSVGSYYSVIGGTLDCNGKANGIVVEGGRETLIKNVCIKAPRTGIFINKGVNGNSSDCDFEDITILGNGKAGTYGVRLIGNDNTFSNMRIYNVEVGFESSGDANFSKGIYVINTDEELIKRGNTVGFKGCGGYSQCYAENFTKAYDFYGRTRLSESVASWSDPNCKEQRALVYNNGVLVVGGLRVYFLQTEEGIYSYSNGNTRLDGPLLIEGD